MALPPGIDVRASGKYRARYRDEEGIQHSRSFDLLRDAKAWMEDQKSSVRKGTHIAPRDRTTVAEYAEKWNSSRTVRSTTAAYRVNALATLKASPLGRMVLSQVRPSDVQAYVGSLSKSKAASTTARHYGWIKGIFHSAVDDRLITFTPCTNRISLPTVERSKLVPLTVEEVRRLAACTADRYRVGMLIQAACGLRISELLALTVSDIDFLRNTVTIDRQLAKYGGGFVAPKTESSRRTIPLAEDVKQAVAAHLVVFAPNKDGLILSGEKGASVRMDKWAIKVFRPAAKKAGLADSVSSHDLRHHFASETLSRNVPANVVAAYMGHTTAHLVLSTYGHLMPSADDVMRKALEAAWTPVVVPAVVRSGLHSV